MPERPAARDDSAIEHQPPPELSREPRVSGANPRDVRETRDVRDSDGADEHESHDPYQPL
ncbi:hypothetical protein [Micromonospora inaquosa]|uniref:Uncharacterized protein n=1 Tax=Micromonospora inaquosa TaxID=2203716 RepID=A0A3N9WNR6_9ACTN|nr:hypothetical protein [Micromonospora inaquosa]RQW95586.1 hypothetical protein DLJ59_32560 [Micromonospora inaquosa]